MRVKGDNRLLRKLRLFRASGIAPVNAPNFDQGEAPCAHPGGPLLDSLKPRPIATSLMG